MLSNIPAGTLVVSRIRFIFVICKVNVPENHMVIQGKAQFVTLLS